MLVQFQVIYKTHIGQQLTIVGSIPELGSGSQQNAKLMMLKDALTGLWVYQVELNSVSNFHYRYFVKDDNFNTFIEEWGPDRIFKPENRIKKTILLFDCWRPNSDPDFALHSSAFVNAILKTGISFKTPMAKVAGAADTIVLRFKPNVELGRAHV